MKFLLIVSVICLISVNAKKYKNYNTTTIDLVDGRCVVNRVHLEPGSVWVSSSPCARMECTPSGYNAVGCAPLVTPPNSTCEPEPQPDKLPVYPACCPKQKCTPLVTSEVTNVEVVKPEN